MGILVSRACRFRLTVRWGWISAIALGCLIGLLMATWLGETGTRLGGPDESDLIGMQAGAP
jgi:hypothetical protein